MAKNTKKGTAHGKPITDYFTLGSKPHPQPSKSRVTPSMPSQASTSQDVRATGVSEITGVLSNKSKVASIASKPPIEPLYKAHGLDGSESSSFTKTGLTKPPFASSSAMSSLKRVRPPDLQSHARASTPLDSKRVSSDSVKIPTRRRGKFDSDSDIEMPNTIVCVNSTLNPQSRKKARLSPLEDSSRVGSLVPSSQSDEDDFMEEQAHLPTTRENNETMEISADNSLISEPITRATFTNCHSRTPNSASNSTGEMSTPPSTDHSFSAPTPFPLDPATKTAQIIAQIKERAYAKIQSSPEVAPLEFNDDLDQSSDDDSFLPVLRFVTKPVSSKGNNTSVAVTFEDTSIKPTLRYSLRNRSPVLSSNSSPSSELSRGTPLKKRPPPKVVKDHKEKGKKTFVACDPFEALLKEKKLAEKSGKGHDAIHRAETTAGKFGKGGLLYGIDEDDWNDQDAAALAVRDRDWLINRPLTPSSNNNGNGDLRLGDAERRKLFGEDGGKAIMGILEHDKIAKREVLNRQVPGSRFWSLPGVVHSTTMVLDEASSIAKISATSPLICLFKMSIQRGDVSRAALILDMDFLSTATPIEQSAIVQYLCDLVLSSQRTLLTEPASRALENHWSSKPTTCGLSFSQVLIAVQHLGTDVAVLSLQKWPISSVICADDVTTEIREDFIRRLVILLNACARARKVRTEEAPDLVLLLLLINTDISTSHDLQLDIIQSIDLICNCIASEDVGFEVALCSKVLNCIAGYEPMNKAHLIASLSAGSGSTKRIASFIAYCVIVDRTTALVEIYSLPPLDDVLEQLQPSLGSSKFSLSETTNYLDLGYYISILAIAMSNIRGYVTEERQSATKHSIPHPLPSPNKRTERPKDLQLVYAALETLHSNISDSKALHLERSRTKAILKGLSMYIHYQRDYWLKHDRGPQSKKLLHYFKKAP